MEKEKEKRKRHKYPDWECPRCKYRTDVKQNMVTHFNRKIPCPCDDPINGIELTDDIKNYVYLNRKYKPTKQTKVKTKEDKDEDLPAIKHCCPLYTSDRDVGHLYIVHLREHIRLDEPIFKIGRSKIATSRLKTYKDSVILRVQMVCKHVDAESELKALLNNDENVKQCRTIGTEYYECDIAYLNKVFDQVVEKYKI